VHAYTIWCEVRTFAWHREPETWIELEASEKTERISCAFSQPMAMHSKAGKLRLRVVEDLEKSDCCILVILLK